MGLDSDELWHVNTIKERYRPANLSSEVITTIGIMTGVMTNITDNITRKELANKWLTESYEELTNAPMDSRHFDDDHHFYEALIKGTIARAQEYEQAIASEFMLSQNDDRQENKGR